MSQAEFDYRFHAIVEAYHEARFYEVAFVLIILANYRPLQGSQDDGCGDQPEPSIPLAPVRRTQA